MGGNYWIAKSILVTTYQPAQAMVSELSSYTRPLEKMYK